MKERRPSDSNYDFSPSTILISRYGHESRRLIHVIEKKLIIIMAIIVATVILSILVLPQSVRQISEPLQGYIIQIVMAGRIL
jgi:hypothetical protein